MPKRVLMVMGSSAFVSVLLAPRLGPELSGTLAVAAGVLMFCGAGAAAVCFCLWPVPSQAVRARIVGGILALMVCSAVLGQFCLNWRAQVEPVEFLEGAQAKARLRILDFPEERYHRYYYQAQVVKLNGIPAGDISIRLSCREPLYCQPHEQIEVPLVFYQFRESGEWFSTRGAQLAAGNVLGAYPVGEVERRIPERVYSPVRLAILARNQVSRGLARYLPPKEAGLVRAVLLGDKSGLSESTVSGFARVGASHLMAVSGLHVSVLAALVLWLVQRIPLGRWSRFFICCTALLFYLCLIGFPASALRSSWMLFLALLDKNIGGRGDGLNALGFALLCICLASPFSGGDLGFVLSAVSTAGIILLYRPLMEAWSRGLRSLPRVSRLLRPLGAAMAVTLSANVFSLPVQLEVFGGISLLLLPANLLLVPLVSGLLYCALPLAALAPFAGAEPLARVFGFCTGWMARLVLGAADALASVPGSFYAFDTLRLSVLGTAALAAVAVLLGAVRRKGTVPLLGLLILVQWAAWVGTGSCREALTIAMAGDEDSACVLLVQDGRAAAVSLGGYRSGIAEQLLAREHVPVVESVLLPESTPQAREMLENLAGSSQVGRLILPEGAYVWKSMEKLELPVEFAPLGEDWELLPGVEVRLDPEREELTVFASGREIRLRLGKPCGVYLSLPGEAAWAREMGILFRSEDMPAQEMFQGEEPGNYIVLDGQDSLFLRLWPDRQAEYGLYD